MSRAGKVGEPAPNATTQTYVLAHYNERVGELVREEFAEWRRVMELCLKRIYGDEVGAREAEGMMILIARNVHLQLQQRPHRRHKR